MSAIYRVSQFLRAVGTWFQPAQIDQDVLGRYLPVDAVRLFEAMPRYDQRHALSVLRLLREQGHTQPDLMAAALLHDVGKTRAPQGSLHLWHRVATVLMRSLSPRLVEQVGRDEPGSWRQPFFVQENHAALGAELARQVGCTPRTVELIRYHEDALAGSNVPLLAELQAADAES
ncbi:MAG: HDIG domain-containing protein [Anaerolineae bacterium]|jgi:putative nucleotidyltransferase with HDIG domain